MKTGSLLCIGVLLCFVLLAIASAEDQGGAKATATAKASASADAKSTGGDAKNTGGDAKTTSGGAKADAKADATAGTSSGKPQPDPAAVGAWRAYISKCDNKHYDPKVTSPGTCANLSGALCSRKDVKCGAEKTDFVDASGKVIATGDHKTEKIA